MSSILNDTKKALGLDASYSAFDPDVIMYTNGVLAKLNQLGIGPAFGFSIEDSSAQWVDFLGPDPRFNMVKSYVYLSVRQIFDPPTTSFLIASFKEQLTEFEVRISILRENLASLSPEPQPTGTIVLDGGDADGGL